MMPTNDIDTFKILNLKGTAYEMGIQHGKYFKEEIAYAIENCVLKWGVKQHSWSAYSMKEFAMHSFQTVSHRIKEEFLGLADGSGISLEDILTWNYIDDYWEHCGCSAFAAKAINSRMIVGRNNDYENDFSNNISVTIVRDPSSGIQTLCHTWAGTIGAYEGINTNGLVVTTQFSETEDRNKFGYSVKQVNFLLLEECRTVDESIEKLKKITLPSFGCNILIADEFSSAVVECSGSGITVRKNPNNISISTNHFLEHISNPIQKRDSHLTEERFQFIDGCIGAHIGNLDVGQVKEILKSPPIGRLGPPDYYTTRSSIYIPEIREVHVAHGFLPSFEGDYLKLNLNQLLTDNRQYINYPMSKIKVKDSEEDVLTFVKPDPFEDLNWNKIKTRSLGYRIFDVWLEYLSKLPDLPVLSLSSSEDVISAMTFDVPEHGLSEDELVEYSKKLFFTNATNVGSPCFLAYIMGAGTLPGVIGDFIAAAMNQNVGGWNLGPSAAEIETKMFQWFAEIFGLPESALGITMSGGSMANFTAIKVARDTIGGRQLRYEGLKQSAQMTIYCSDRSHVTIDRAADMLGLGMNAVRKIETDENFKMVPDKLIEAIEHDLHLGYKPFIVVGTAGTTSFGSIDPLTEISHICQKYNLWFHVDGAYGALAILSDEAKPLLKGIELADSITFDPHKWLYISQSASCVLFRDMRLAKASFVVDDDYVYEDKEVTKTGIDFSDYGPQWSRGFSALKIWFSLIAYGTQAYSKRISHDILLAKYFSNIVQKHDDFELMAKPNLSICCFRYRPQFIPTFKSIGDSLAYIHRENPAYIDVNAELYLDDLNKEILTSIQLDGKFFPSSAVLNDRFVLRICIVNYRTEANHLDDFLYAVANIGNKLNQSHISTL